MELGRKNKDTYTQSFVTLYTLAVSLLLLFLLLPTVFPRSVRLSAPILNWRVWRGREREWTKTMRGLLITNFDKEYFTLAAQRPDLFS